MTIDELLPLLSRVHRSGAGWNALCPAHPDKDPSLSISEGADGRILLNCFAGCTAENVCAALNLPVSALFADSNGNARQANPNPARPKVKTQPSFQGTEEIVERMCVGLIHSRDCQAYIESRGISLKVASELKWGFVPSWSFKDGEGKTVRKPALVIPHYMDGKVVGTKFRTIDGTKLFSQMPGSSIDGLYGRPLLDPDATSVVIVESPEDCALLISHGFNAVAINSTASKVNTSDVAVLSKYKAIFVTGDQDLAGQKAMNALQQQLPAEQVIRVHFPAYKDVGDLWKADPAHFEEKFRHVLRFARGSRDHFNWTDLLDEDEISEAQNVDRYAIDKLVPANAISMLFGEEKGGKSLLSRYLGKCVANKCDVFGKYATTKMPVLCLDLENNSQDLRDFTKHFARLGPEKIRYRTRRTGCPALDSPALLRLCEREQPLIIIDSMTKFLNGADPYHPGEMSDFFDKLLNLCAAGATIILIHHATRADVERYANSHQIGANVARAFSVVSEDRPRLNRVRLDGQLFRGSEPVTENLIGFPVIAERGEFGLSSQPDPYQTDLDSLIEFVRAQTGSECSKEAIKNRKGKSHAKNIELVATALKLNLLVKKQGKISVPDARDDSSDFFSSPTAGTTGDA